LIELKLEKYLTLSKSMLTESLRFNDMTLAYAVIPANSKVAVIANESVLEGYRFSHELS
jgi:hypothetical protein